MNTANKSMKEEKKKVAVFFWWLMTAGYMVTIYYLSSINIFRLSVLPDHFDKIVHVLIYLPLAFLLYIALKKSGLKNNIMVVAFLIAGVYGITDELHQSFVPGRIPSIGDVIADFIGAFLGSLGASFLKT